MFHDYYEILNLDPSSTSDEIKRAFRKRAREEHPDLHPENSAAQTYEMHLLNEAYEVLSNPGKRKSYDRKWRAYYNVKGDVQRTGGDESDVALSWRKRSGHSDENGNSASSEHFWSDWRFLLTVLIALVIILLISIQARFV